MAQTLSNAYAKAKSDIKGRLDGHYQHEGVKWMLKRELESNNGPKGGILADDMGLGKTMQAISTMRGNPQNTLIITIVGTVAQWRDALMEFGGYGPIIVNPSFQGILPTMDSTSVVLTTYSCFQKATIPECFNVPWGRIILDEGHTIRNPSSKTYRHISMLSGDIKWILSGTPLQNSPKDLLALAEWIGLSTPSSKADQVDHLKDIVSSLVLRRTQEQQASLNPRLALPGLDTQVVRLEFASEDERDFYERVDEYYANQVASNTKNSNLAMEAILRCRQAATHPRLFMDILKLRQKRKRTVYEQEWNLPSTSTKFTYLINDITSHIKEKSLVFCNWTHEMRIIQGALKAEGVSSLIYDGNLSRDNKEATLYNFKNTTIPVLILQINCGNAGLNLQAASRVYITSPHWNPCVDLQAIGRAYRKGQTNKVTCIRLMMADTIEDRCGDVQMSKLDIIREAMDDDSMMERMGNVSEDF